MMTSRLVTLPALIGLVAATFGVSRPAQAAMLECGTRAQDPSRIVVAGGSITEILYDLQEQQRIIGADRTSNYPAEARELPQVGYVRNLSAEGVLSLEPTLVMGEHDMGPPEVVEQLERLDIDLIRVPEEFSAAGISAKVRCVAAAVGADAAGEALVKRMLAQVDDPSAAQASTAAKPRGIVLLGLRGGAPVAAGRETSGDGLLAMAGAANVMDDFEGWKSASIEAIAEAAPEFIVIPERGVRDAGGLDALLDHPAIRLTPAAASERIVTMDGMAMLGFGPRTIEAAGELRQKIAESQ
ncbi:MAG: ABC transporter substrate-binding protein [Pseudomonadota bacterium]